MAKEWATILAGARNTGREPPLDEGLFPLGLMRSRSPLVPQRSNVPLDEARSEAISSGGRLDDGALKGIRGTSPT